MKRENYSHSIADAKKTLKRKQAEHRQMLRVKRSDTEQLELIKLRCGESKKEVERLKG